MANVAKFELNGQTLEVKDSVARELANQASDSVAGVNERVDSLEDTVADNSADIDTNEQNIASLSRQVSGQDNTINTVYNNVIGVQQRTSVLESEIKDVEAVNSSQNNRLNNLEGVSETLGAGINANSTAIDVLESRVDDLSTLPEGSTTGDAELIGIRTEFNGVVANNAGNAVRDQANTLAKRIDSKNVFAIKSYRPVDGDEVYLNGYYNSSGAWVSSTTLGQAFFSKSKTKRYLYMNQKLGNNTNIHFWGSNHTHLYSMPLTDFTTTGEYQRTSYYADLETVYGDWEYVSVVFSLVTGEKDFNVYFISKLSSVYALNSDSLDLSIVDGKMVGFTEEDFVKPAYDDLIPTWYGTLNTVDRNYTSGLMYFKKGTVLDCSCTNTKMNIRGFDQYGLVDREDVNRAEFNEDTLAYVTYYVNGSFTWEEYTPYMYPRKDRWIFIRILHADVRKNNQWKGKTWYCFGTSLSDIGLDDSVGNYGHAGKYPLSLTTLLEANRNNQAVGSNGLVPSQSGGLVRQRILNTPYDVDLVTIECLPNDTWYTEAGLGEIGDTDDTTIIGCLTQCFNYLTNYTRARVVLLTVTGPISPVGQPSQTGKYPATGTSRISWRNACDRIIELAKLFDIPVIDADAECIEWGKRVTGKTYKDHIHLNYLGGELMGRFIFNKLLEIHPDYTVLPGVDEQPVS